MRLTLYTDYALRVLIYLAARPEARSSIAEIAKAYGISQNHLMKVVNELARAGFVASMRGRSGGVSLARPAAEINVGAVVRRTEDGFELVDCGQCAISPACGLTGVLAEAVTAFLRVLDSYSLADLVNRKRDLRALLGLGAAAS